MRAHVYIIQGERAAVAAATASLVRAGTES